MFGLDFYPTPKAVIRKMLSGFKPEDIAERTILEPSAGKGDIVEYLADQVKYRSNWNRKPENVYCIESDLELRLVLSGKGYKVIGSDFLTYKKNHLFDLIVMNPPFSQGAAHLLKAWEILNGGDIVCLLNAETVLNPHTKERELLGKIIEENGSYEILGDCFSEAERKTKVNVALVRLHKKAPEVVFDFFEQKTKEKTVSAEEFDGGNLPAMKDTFGNLEIAYDNAREACAEYLKAKSKAVYYLKAAGLSDDEPEKVFEEKTFNEMIDRTKEFAWDSLFTKTKIASVMTQKVRQDFDEFRKTSGGMDFTKENMQSIFETLFQNRGEIMKQCILDAFERMTRYDKKNAVHVEGWKTNDAWKVNQKVIVPWGCRAGFLGKPEIDYRMGWEFSDIEKALCFIAGEQFEGYQSSIYERVHRGGFGFGEWVSSRFFDFKMFKKGTIHLKFNDDRIWQEFNIRAAQYKHWLPDDYNEREKAHEKAAIA